MREEKNNLLTFANLDREKGISELAPATGEEYPLPAWYRAVRDIPLAELGVEDICKACRQQIHLEQVVPMVLHLLKVDPLAGEMYDGELLVSLKSVPLDYWSMNEIKRLALKTVAESALRQEKITPDVREDAQELLHRMSNLG